MPPVTAGFVSAIGWIVPAFSAFDVKAQIVHGLPLAPSFVPLTLAYAISYVLAVLVAAVMVFSRREFK